MYFVQSSYYDTRSRLNYRSGSVRSMERVSYSNLPSGHADGYDEDIIETLQYITDHYGPVTSFSSAYRANHWTVNIKRTGGWYLAIIAH